MVLILHLLTAAHWHPRFSQSSVLLHTDMLTHTYTDTCFSKLEIFRLCLWNFSHFPSIWIRNFYAFSSLCGMLSICPAVLGGNRISLWTEMFDILRSVVCVRVHACVWARVHSCCCLCISMQSLQVCGSVSKSKTHQRKRSFLPSLHSHCLTFHPFFPVIPPSFPLSFLSPLCLTSARISARVDALLHQSSSSVFIYHLFLEIYFKLDCLPLSPTSYYPFPCTAYLLPLFSEMKPLSYFCLFTSILLINVIVDVLNVKCEVFKRYCQTVTELGGLLTQKCSVCKWDEKVCV